MAIIADATSNSGADRSNPIEWSHTVGSGSNRVLVVGCGWRDGGGKYEVTGVTFGGVALTKAVDNTGANSTNAELWYLANPAVGAGTISMAMNGNPDFGCAGAVSFFGVNQSDPLGSTDSNSGSGAPSISFTTTTFGEMVVDAVFSEASTLTEGAGQTAYFDNEFNGDSAAGSYELDYTPGTVTMSYSESGNHTHVVASFNPAKTGAFILNYL